jgi:hypothetical protein
MYSSKVTKQSPTNPREAPSPYACEGEGCPSLDARWRGERHTRDGVNRIKKSMRFFSLW